MKRPRQTTWVFLFLLAAPLASAQEEEMEVEFFFDEAETVVSAARHRQEIGMSPSAIWVITREDIATSGAESFVDLFRMVPGMSALAVTPMLGAFTGRMTWSNESLYFLVLIDGREANIELMGVPFLSVEPISLEDVERIEIIRGPGSALYGANAFTGVISITTRAVQEQTRPACGWAQLSGGEPGSAGAQARASARIGSWGFSVGGGAERTGLYTDSKTLGLQTWKLRSLAEYRWSNKRRLSLDLGLSEGRGPLVTLSGSVDVRMPMRTLQLGYTSEELRGHLYWRWNTVHMDSDTSLEFGGVELARMVPMDVDAHTLDGEVQWTLPRFYRPLLLIVGGGGRFSYLASDQLLDADTYPDPASPDYHRPGIRHLEARAGAFVHGEYQPADWLTLTAGARLDYNTETDIFLSPRLAAVFRPAAGQFVRVGVARAFRKPAFIESRLHPLGEFPETSPIQGSEQVKFLEFATRIQGNAELENEALLSLEAGYLGSFLDGRLRVTWDLYYNRWNNEIALESDLVIDPATGLPDLELSSFMLQNSGSVNEILGSEIAARLELSRSVSLTAYWDHRQVHEAGHASDRSPKNLMGLGGRFRLPSGLQGSLYAFSRSEFTDRGVQNPDGLLEGSLTQHMDTAVLFVGRLGWAFGSRSGSRLETGVRLRLPVSFSAPHFRFREEGGGVTLQGTAYGGYELARAVTAYLQGSF